jgi:HYD1 signature containing ADP-ribosyltransferase
LSVFHYTSAGGYQSILQDRLIKPSIQGIGRPDAIAGTGIYLTDLSPHSIDRSDANAINALAVQIFGVPFAAYKVLYFFELELNDVERVIPPVDEQGRPRNHIFIYRTSTALAIDEFLIRHGETGGEVRFN